MKNGADDSMKRTTRGRRSTDSDSGKNVDIKIKHWKLRLVFVILFAIVGISALANGVLGLLSSDDGWQEIEADSSSTGNNGSEFIFEYYLGASGLSVSAEKKALISLYTSALETAYQNFHNEESFDGVNNICYINAHPNEEIVVDDILYDAFALMEESGGRQLYLGPIYTEYNNLFYCNDDWETAEYDPYQNEEVAEYFAEILSYASSDEQIELRLLGDNTIMLYVSDEYLAYAKETGFLSYIDFFWMKNAFIIDYLADTLIENGYTLGAISSYDGFVRNLDTSGTEWTFNIYNRVEQTVYQAASMEYEGARSIVFLRDYMMNSSFDVQHYYELEDGEFRTAYIDTADGYCKSSIDSLVSYSENLGCAEILLRMLPIYIADEFDADALEELREDGIYSIYCEEQVIYCNDPDVSITDLYDEDDVTYVLE
ncbi:MAG: hypothetical protein LUH20_00310 [Lachnospiraceae bacterium]|nr:hypothetical protein [Lachnospiraceae bacterium]